MASGVKTLILTIIYVAIFAELGVLSRIYLNRLFNGGCDSPTGGTMCLTSKGTKVKGLGAYFYDVPPNILGSYFIGVLSSAATLGLLSGKAAAGLPQKHSWQSNKELFIGLRTGFCGSLTTFASWEIQMVFMIFGGAGYTSGQVDQAIWGWFIGTLVAMGALVLGEHTALVFDRVANRFSPASETTAVNPEKVSDEPVKMEAAVEESGPEPFLRKTDILAILALLGVTAVFLWAAIVDTSRKHTQRRSQWVAVLFGPAGASLRWYLSRFNTQQPKIISWFPLGTYIANMSAVILDYGVQCYLVRHFGPPSTVSYTRSFVLPAIKTGFGGSLSTVSTWVVEIRTLLKRFPDHWGGYFYCVFSIFSGFIFAIPIYCWSVWK